jgi:exo-1,4-beta-D-glucosaminidase
MLVIAALAVTGAALAAVPAGGQPARPSPPVASGNASALSAAVRTATEVGGPPAHGSRTLGLQGWQVQSSAEVPQGGAQISTAGFPASHWLAVKPDDAGAPGTEIEALLQQGACPDVFYSDNMRKCFGEQPQIGAEAVARFAVPWWYRTTFTAPPRGQNAKLVINGVVGQADVWLNGTEVATQQTVQGNYTQYSFDVTRLLRPGTNALALAVHPNNPNKMFTVDNVDWTQIPPDQNTGIQFPVQLKTSEALSLSDAHVNQVNSGDLRTSKLTVKAVATNNSTTPQTGTVSAVILDPSGHQPIFVHKTVTVGGSSAVTVAITPSQDRQLVLHHPQLWWPYQMGRQPLYTLVTALDAHGRLVNSSTEQFGIRTVTSSLIGPSPLAPGGVRSYAINGKPFVIRGGGFSENLFLHYSAHDTANQIALIKSMGLNMLRLEGHFMPDDFYNQMDRAGILIGAGYQCCDAWELSDSKPATADQLRVLGLSAATVGARLRNHPSVFTFQWSDNQPTPQQEAVSLAAFDQVDLEVPIIASAEYKSTPTLGLSGEKEGPYDWVPPSYWYDTSHSDYNDDDSLTNVGGSWGLDSEQSAGHTIPTLDSINRFLSPLEQNKLWTDPSYNQYHANNEPGTSGYAFGTLANFDTALASRYGQWSGLQQYVQQAQVQNYEDVRAQFEAFIDHSTNAASPSTGTIYWMANKGWPTLLWDLYNYDYDEGGSYFGAQKANEAVHAIFATDNNTVTIDNLTGRTASDLSVQATVYGLDGSVLDRQSAAGIQLASQQVRTRVLQLEVPTTTAPPTPATAYFVELLLRRNGQQVSRNVYWESSQPDLVDWPATMGNPQATISQYSDLRSLQDLPAASVKYIAHSTRSGSGIRTTVTISNVARTPRVAFFLRADVRRGNGHAELSGDNQVLPITWSDNDITLWPGETETLTASYPASELHGATPMVSLYGWNLSRGVQPAGGWDR